MAEQPRNVFVIDGARTPYIRALGIPGPFTASDLAVQSGRALLLRQPFTPDSLDEVILGNILSSPDEVNIARVASQRLGCGVTVPAWTVQRNCGSGMQAVDCAYQAIRSGRADLVLAGGVEAMSHAPLLFSTAMTTWLGRFNAAKSQPERLRSLSRLRPAMLKPVIALLRGLSDPVAAMNMGQTAEELAFRFRITREDMDAYAVQSHLRVVAAREEGRLGEIEALYEPTGKLHVADDGVRADSSVEKLARLKPVFDRPFGMVTAGNSSQITDGAAWVILAGEKSVKKYGLPVLARIVDSQWAGLAPQQMGLGPVHAMTPILKRHKLKPGDIDYYEINEAFAAHVLACLAAWRDAAYCRKELHLRGAMGEIDQQQLNMDGGAIALGHPVGSSGARILLHLCHVLEQRKANRGLASLCIGGGQGGAMLLERS